MVTPPLGRNNRILIVWDFIIHLCCLTAFSWGFYRSHWHFWPWTGCDWTHTRTHSDWFDHVPCLLLRLTSCVFWLCPSFIWLDAYPSVGHVINPPVLLISPLPSALMWSLSNPLFVWTQLSELPYSSVGTTIRDLLKGEKQSTCLSMISSFVHDLQSTSLLPPTGAWGPLQCWPFSYSCLLIMSPCVSALDNVVKLEASSCTADVRPPHVVKEEWDTTGPWSYY